MDKKTALIVLDGFGITPEKRGNAVMLAKKPYLDEVFGKYPKALLRASGQEVGLPWGEVGNSEVGHSGIGLGRVVLQDLPQIDKSISEGMLKRKKIIQAASSVLNNLRSNLHIIGLASDGAVHCHVRHMIALYKIFREKVPPERIFFHIIADGRDSPEKSVYKYIDLIKKEIDDQVRFASLSGRFYAMDRDKNWDRIEKAQQAILGKNKVDLAISEAVKTAYEKGETDEFITPVSLPDCPDINFDFDIFLFANYRSDRAIQLTRSFVDSSVEEIKTRCNIKNFITMTTYSEDLPVQVLFTNIELANPKNNPLNHPLSEILSLSGINQVHIAETEKFAHVTYFFSGGVTKPFKNEKDILVKSGKIKSYDKDPKMKAEEISREILRNAKGGTRFILANYANGDMVGHSGNLEAATRAVEILDENLSKVLPDLLKENYDIYLTSDHGNCDEMIDLKSGHPNKEHSLNPVPFIYISKSMNSKSSSFPEFVNSQPIGVLADIAPTILEDLGIKTPKEMGGINLRTSLI